MAVMFNKRHYEAVAKIIQDRVMDLENNERAAWARDFARLFRGDNPNFKRHTFMKACGLPEDT